MMKASSVFLRRELLLQDVRLLAGWMADPYVCQYLKEDSMIVRGLEELSHLSVPTLMPLFNQNGRFYMLCHRQAGALGFIRLMRLPAQELELVIAVGERHRWGQGYGKAGIAQALREAFFDMRQNAVVANVHQDNFRSRNALGHNGFGEAGRHGAYLRYRITMQDFLNGFDKSK